MTDGPDDIDPAVLTLPKVSLHDHLDGGLRPATILELADEAGVPVPADDPDSLTAWFAESADSGDLPTYLGTFALTTAVMQSAEQLARVAREAVEDLAADGVIWGELRWAPEQHTAGGLSMDDAVVAVQAGLDAGVAAARESGVEIGVGQLVTALRQDDRALETARLALAHRDTGVVGFDLAGPEAGFPPSAHREAFELLARELFPVTVHAGEADGTESIRSALLDGRALRLGHGTRIADDVHRESQDDENVYVTLGRLGQWVKDRGIALELSPTSNVQTGAVVGASSIDEHPFDLLYQLGFRVTVNTDNRLVSRTSLSRELSRLADAFAYGLEDLEEFQLNAAESAFLPLEDRQALASRITEGFARAGR